jgi:hypothetical protein
MSITRVSRSEIASPTTPQEAFVAMLDAIDEVTSEHNNLKLVWKLEDAKALWGRLEVEAVKAKDAAENPFRHIEGDKLK